MDAILGSNFVIFFAITIVIMGFASFMAGQALATTWRPIWQLIPYGILLGAADRFLSWALFGGSLFAPIPYLVNMVVLLVICLLAFRLTTVRKMVTQYPWVYERTGPFTWRQKAG